MQRATGTNREFKTLLTMGAIVVLVLVVVTLLFNRSQPGNMPIPASAQALLIRDDSPTRGPADAPVTLVEFLDPECESCRAVHPDIEQILADYDGRIRYVVRYFSNHRNSELAIAATEAAGEQGKYWEMQRLLFENQPDWGERIALQTEIFVGYAEELGLDVKRFAASLQNPIYLDKAQRDQLDARSLGLLGTPTFYVNGRTVYGVNAGAIRALIDEELGAKGK